MSVRQWRVTDLYAVLGVSPRATEDEIDAAFRELALRWHPDRCNGDPIATERFKHVTAAYDVIGHPERRARYDEERALAGDSAPDPAVPPATDPVGHSVAAGPRTAERDDDPRGPTWSDTQSWGRPEPEWRGTTAYRRPPRRSRRVPPVVVLVAGIVCLVGGVLLAGWRLSVGRAGSSFGVDATRTTGTIVRHDGHRSVEFRTTTGATVVTRPGGAHSDDVGSSVRVVYDRAEPTRAVVDHDSLAKEITIWIAALKLVVGGLVMIVVSRSKRMRDWLARLAHRQRLPVPT